MVSTVVGTVPRDLPVSAALRRLFPCGSITGAPKIRTMEIIEQLETGPRGVYTGALGYVLPDGDYCFNVPIRTIVSTTEGRGELGLGSGIIEEADSRAEYAECLLKARFLTAVNDAFQLIESMRLVAGEPRPERFDQHLARLRESARVLGFEFDRARIEETVLATVAARPAPQDGVAKVRVLLHANGRVEVSVEAIESAPEPVTPRLVSWSAERVDTRSVLQYHKTTARSVYDREHQAAARRDGAYDVLFLNERGEVAEAARHNVFVEKDGVLLTPPVSAGILPGVARAAVLEGGLAAVLAGLEGGLADPSRKAREAVLLPVDVLRATRVFLTNSVRGMVEVQVIDSRASRG